MSDNLIPEYGWENSDATCAHSYLLPGIEQALNSYKLSFDSPQSSSLRLFDAGCGNGYLAHALAKKGYEVAGCDYSREGVAHALDLLPNSRFEVMSVYDNMADRFGENWDIVLSSEVVEHLYDPGKFVHNVFSLLRPGGVFIVTTPYHGYLKNLVMAISGRMDQHFTVLWDGGHIKFWSNQTLSILLQENGFIVDNFYGAGRFPWLWKSMIISAKKRYVI